jgi:hypothetical protein
MPLNTLMTYSPVVNSLGFVVRFELVSKHQPRRRKWDVEGDLQINVVYNTFDSQSEYFGFGSRPQTDCCSNNIIRVSPKVPLDIS